MENLSPSVLIIIFSSTIILSYFFNVIGKRYGVPSVLLLIFLGIIINFSITLMGVEKPNLLPVLEVLGVVGLILIVLEASLDLRILKSKLVLITKSLLASFIGLVATSYIGGIILSYFTLIPILNCLLYTIPLSILSSAIILPSIEGLEEEKKEFLIYESTFSDIWGIIGFYSVLQALGTTSVNVGLQKDIFSNLFISLVFSVVISYLLIYIFQNIKSNVKLFLLIAILLLLYALGGLFNLSSLLIILIFGLILNNYTLFFKGKLMSLLNIDRVDQVLEDIKLISAESAFVMRTFFFIIFGWSVSLISLFDIKVVFLGSILLFSIYFIRFIMLLIFNGKNLFPQVFLAPRGLITILLFFAIPDKFKFVFENISLTLFDYSFNGLDIEGVLLFVILGSCIIMSWALIYQKKQTLYFEKNNLSLNDEVEDNEFLTNTKSND